MKAPNTDTIFAPVASPSLELSDRLLDLFLAPPYGGALGRYHARMELDPDHGSYLPEDESMGLQDRDDLQRRLRHDGNGSWVCDLNLGFYPAYIKVMLLAGQPAGPPPRTTTVVLSINSGLSTFLLNEERPRAPYITFLTIIATTLGADYFLTGLELDHWRPMPPDEVVDPARWPPLTCAVGWRPPALDEGRLLAGLGKGEDAVRHSTVGYRFLNLFPPP